MRERHILLILLSQNTIILNNNFNYLLLKNFQISNRIEIIQVILNKLFLSKTCKLHFKLLYIL